MKFATEYLIMCSDTESFCDSIESLTQFFCLDSRIKMRNGKIIFGDPKIEATYKVNRGEIVEKKQSYFQISFSIEREGDVLEKDIDAYTDLLKAIKALIHRVEWHIEVLWDDVSSYYANKAYPLIHEIESLMRKLIQNFMLITIGRDWTKSSLPKEVLDIFSKSKRKEESNQLHSLDFIDLAAILVKPYSTSTTEDLHKCISRMLKNRNFSHFHRRVWFC